ncbi:MAG: hypothetical protein ACPL7J_06425 [Desulfomonilaceae bacterium]
MTDFHIISDGAWDGAVKEEDIPWAIVLDEVHAPEPPHTAGTDEASLEWGLPAPVLFALSFLLALAVFCSAD